MQMLINTLLFLSLTLFCTAMYIESNHVVSSFSGMSPERVRFQRRRISAHRSCIALALIAVTTQFTYLIVPILADWNLWTTRVIFTYGSILLFALSIYKLAIARKFFGK